MMPYREFYYEANASDNAIQPCFSLNYTDQTVAMSAAKYFSFVMIGKFELQDDVLKMSFESNENTYSYVFYKHENGFMYSAENSTPATTGGFDFADGLYVIEGDALVFIFRLGLSVYILLQRGCGLCVLHGRI